MMTAITTESVARTDVAGWILHVAPDGEVLRRIPVLDVLYTNGLARYLVKGMLPHPETILEDPTHLNDVEPLGAERASAYPSFEAGDLLVSLRTPSLVFVVDPTSLEVKWTASTPFLHQHDPDFLGHGWTGVFDNNQDPTPRGTMLGGSRIVALSPSTDSMKTLFPTARSEPFYTATAGQRKLPAHRSSGRPDRRGRPQRPHRLGVDPPALRRHARALRHERRPTRPDPGRRGRLALCVGRLDRRPSSHTLFVRPHSIPTLA